jgi:hypothetical protein
VCGFAALLVLGRWPAGIIHMYIRNPWLSVQAKNDWLLKSNSRSIICSSLANKLMMFKSKAIGRDGWSTWSNSRKLAIKVFAFTIWKARSISMDSVPWWWFESDDTSKGVFEWNSNSIIHCLFSFLAVRFLGAGVEKAWASSSFVCYNPNS